MLNPQLNSNGELTHLLSIEGLSRDILLTNRAAILSNLAALQKATNKLSALLSRAKAPEIERFLTAAQKRRERFFR